jgi:hypothetical protein
MRDPCNTLFFQLLVHCRPLLPPAAPSPCTPCRQIQEILVSTGDKPASLIGSSQWLGSFELGYILDAYLGITYKVCDGVPHSIGMGVVVEVWVGLGVELGSVCSPSQTTGKFLVRLLRHPGCLPGHYLQGVWHGVPHKIGPVGPQEWGWGLVSLWPVLYCEVA